VVLASPRASCAGVDRAVEIVETALRERGAPVYVRKQIVHNAHVVGRLESLGAVFVDELDAVRIGRRIVARLNGPAGLARADAGVIVTEYGVADLRGLSLARRRERMIAIAHPDHRAALESAAGD